MTKKGLKIARKFDNIISHGIIVVKVLPNPAEVCIDTQSSLSVTETECGVEDFRVYRHGENRYFLIAVTYTGSVQFYCYYLNKINGCLLFVRSQ